MAVLGFGSGGVCTELSLFLLDLMMKQITIVIKMAIMIINIKTMAKYDQPLLSSLPELCSVGVAIDGGRPKLTYGPVSGCHTPLFGIVGG